MSLLLKLGLVGITVGGVVTFSQVPDLRARMPVDVPGLSGLAGLVGIGASAAGSAGPIDKAFAVRRVHIDGMVAKVEIVTLPQPGPVRLQASGKPETMKELQIRSVGDELFLRLDTDKDEAWFPWNLFNMWSKDRKIQDLSIRISAPTGTPYEIEGMIGIINAGDIDAPLRLEAHAVQARFGRVDEAQVSIAGSGRIILGAVKETLDLEVAGSGNFEAASAKAAQIEIAGGGNVTLGPVATGLSAEVAGSGTVRVASVNGPVDIEIAGSGDILINGGRANPLKVEIAGSGDVVLKGEAVDPNVEIMGSGRVKVNSYTGHLRQEIMGSGRFDVMSPAAANVTP
jgi:Putative auto-transporter adhesin, head GIN domain